MAATETLAAIAGAAGAVGTLTAAAMAARAFGNARLIASMPPTPVAKLDPGLHEVRGTLAGDGELVSPLSQRPCLYFRLLLEQRRRNRWETVVDLREARPSALVDASGRVGVDLTAAEVVVAAAQRVRTGVFAVPSAELDELLERLGPVERTNEPAGPFLRWREEVLGAGDVVYAVGTAKRDEDGWTLGAEEGPYVISDRDEAEVIRHQRRAGRRWAAIGLGCAVVAGWGVVQWAPGVVAGL